MKKLVIVASVSFGLHFPLVSYAQVRTDSLRVAKRTPSEYKWGLGAGLSTDAPDGSFWSVKYFLSSKSALQFTAGRIQKPLMYSLLFERHHFILHSKRLRLLYGGGITTAWYTRGVEPISKRTRYHLDAWATVQSGFEYSFPRFPLALGTDARISLYRDNGSGYSQGRINRMEVFAHYTFGKK